MTEAEVIEQSVEYMGLLLLGVSLIFSVVSAYIVALNYFVGDAMFMARLGAFAFVSLILALLMVVMIGAENTHSGLVEQLILLSQTTELTPAGIAVIENTQHGVDGLVRFLLWAGMLSVFGALAYMTFLHRWTPDIVNVALQPVPSTS
jgi:hypothetical protein